ncbi:MAG: glycine C-acetyltransferase [Candidatus Burarchaeum sp.]|nr:glycine C-acetyltransferase [Candidatus Burarchaeum sp.]MDO8339792.1 glycine C-acetyltransferase [Candidatus Burarchaeum sp.]
MVDRNPTAFLKQEYDELVTKSLDWRPRTLMSPSRPKSKVDGKRVLMLCSNNYLGLSDHPELKLAAIKAVRKYGAGSGSVRAIAGTMQLHLELEETIARFKKTEAALYYQTGFAANAGLIPQLVGEGDLVISDALNHGSIIDGVRLSKAERAIFKHKDTQDLARVLEEAEGKNPAPRRILIITDGVFSMDGDIAPLPGIVAEAEKHGAMVYVDDAHGDGVLGDHGRGIVDHFHLHGKVHVDMGTFSKGFGVVGGSVAGSTDLRNFALNKSRTWLLSGSAPPAVAAACTAALNLLERDDSLVKKLWENTKFFKEGLKKLGFDIGSSETPITPVIVGESEKAVALSQELFKKKVFALPIVFPMVAKDKARIRTMITAAHSREELEFALGAFEACGKKLKIIS